MYKRLIVLLPCLVSLNLYAAPQENTPAEETTPPAAGIKQPHFSSGSMQGRIFGTILETMDAGGYTYILLDTGTRKVWAASPRTPVRRGSMVAVSTQMPMKNFHSKALRRDFELVYFTDRIIKDNMENSVPAPAAAPQEKAAEPAPDAPVEGIQKAKDGKTIAEILDQKQALAGQSVRVRGKVVKYSSQIMGRNWIHIRDSSTAKDLTITTSDAAARGDVILVEGKVTLDSDFGYGYVYAVMLENGSITVE